MLTRRTLTLLGLLALSPGRGLAAGGAAPALSAPEPMDLDRLAALARDLRDKPHVPRREVPGAAPVLDELTYGPMMEIEYPAANALWPDGPSPVTMFHLSKLHRLPVRVYALEDGKAREVVYDPALFRMPPGNPALGMPWGAGFAGVRYQDGPGGDARFGTDWVAFLGASYFRMAGDDHQYGVSARGVAVDTAPMPGGREEFPDFTRFYVSPFEGGSATVLALLEGPGLTGAYRFVLRREPHAVTEVECRLFLRRDIARLGIAPGTSMMWYSEGTSRWLATEWRPEIHDSDGLLMHAGTGEVLWRPLNNPPRVTVSAFSDVRPRGFGLMQRDRSPASYVDDGFMEKRPNLWVEPRGDWGAGSVQLVEIPAHQEYDDNIVAMWVPAAPARAGTDLAFSYVLRWTVDEPVDGLARCVATRASKAAWLMDADRKPGRPSLFRTFVVEFEGKALAGKDPERAQAVLDLSRGVAGEVAVAWGTYREASPWRVSFKVYAEGPEPVEMRLFVRADGKPLTETWVYQLHQEQPGTLL